MSDYSCEYVRGTHIIIPIVLYPPTSALSSLGNGETIQVIVDTGTNTGLVLSQEEFNRFVWAQASSATMRGAGSGVVKTGWSVVGIGGQPADNARQVQTCDGGDRLSALYDAAGAKQGLEKGAVRGQAGMAFLDSFPEWSSESKGSKRVFTIGM
jgi:hypothetical protein